MDPLPNNLAISNDTRFFLSFFLLGECSAQRINKIKVALVSTSVGDE